MAVKPTGDRKIDRISSKYYQFLLYEADEAKAKSGKEQFKKELLNLTKIQGEADDKGSKYLELDKPVQVGGKTYSGMKAERRTSPVFDPEKATQLLEEKGLYNRAAVDEFSNHIFQLIENFSQPVSVSFQIGVDQEELYLAYQEDKITEEELDSCFTEEEYFAFIKLQG
jgi:hypothetical protein